MAHDFQADIDAVTRTAAVPTILDVVCGTTGMGFAAVARVTDGRWIACSVKDSIQFGLKPGDELRIETTICNEIRGHHKPVVINDVATDDVYCRHETPKMYGFQSYISMPIMLADGTFFGTLCAIDPRPHLLNTPAVLGMFKLFAELIALHLDLHGRLAATEARLTHEMEAADLREQFIAVLGHDLRNPLALIQTGTRELAKAPLDPRLSVIVGLMQGSVSRMSALIDDVLDFARGRLGGGFAVTRTADPTLQATLHQVIEELRTAHPGRSIEAQYRLNQPVNCDCGRIGQLFGNLLSNALTHGAQDTPVRAQASTDRGTFRLSVSNAGAPIPPEAMEQLFQPFFRHAVRPSQQGLGLGLYIASQIAQAHDGTLDVVSTPLETRFTLRMPCAPP